jgi:hypothetical protein
LDEEGRWEKERYEEGSQEGEETTAIRERERNEEMKKLE